MFREKKELVLVTAWTEVPAFTSPLRASGERAEVFIFAIRIRTLDPRYAF